MPIFPNDAISIAQTYHLPLLDLNAFDLKYIPEKIINEKLIRAHQILPLGYDAQFIFLAVANPGCQNALNEIKFLTGLTPYCIVVEQHKLNTHIQQLLNIQELTALTNNPVENDQDAPIVRYIEMILMQALHKNASDIHFELYEKFYRVRFRIDGILYEIAAPPLEQANRITARIKILAQLDISERRIPQDGRFNFTDTNNNKIDLRVSTCPTLHGEKIVLRILETQHNLLLIAQLGLEPSQETIFLQTIKQPQGMILVTGPTGSGKTITLYNALHLLNTEAVNILSIEDPVEIYLPGINQVNINPKAGLTFATALRAFLRQDPDIIMLGEMRDLETADIGIKAAQTGHLVLSTLHTNSAAESLIRLANMGVAQYNIASSALLIIAQRLLRRLCEHCKQPDYIDSEILLQQGFNHSELTNLTLYRAVGCDQCTHGYQDRIGIFELLQINKSIEQIILSNGSAIDIRDQACKEGMQTLRQSALNKVEQGITSLTEINRVTQSQFTL